MSCKQKEAQIQYGKESRLFTYKNKYKTDKHSTYKDQIKKETTWAYRRFLTSSNQDQMLFSEMQVITFSVGTAEKTDWAVI